MKKILLTLIAATAAALTLAQTSKHSFELPMTALFSNDDNSWRGGVAPRIHSYTYTDESGYKTILSGNLYILTNLDQLNKVDPFRKLYLGYGWSASIITKRNFEFGFDVAWTADFNDIQDPKDGKIGIGGHLTWKW